MYGWVGWGGDGGWGRGGRDCTAAALRQSRNVLDLIHLRSKCATGERFPLRVSASPFIFFECVNLMRQRAIDPHVRACVARVGQVVEYGAPQVSAWRASGHELNRAA